jgi:hypothetical protein
MSLTESLAAETKALDINVNCILPGTVDTPQNRAAMPDQDHGTWVPTDALADVMLFPASMRRPLRQRRSRTRVRTQLKYGFKFTMARRAFARQLCAVGRRHLDLWRPAPRRPAHRRRRALLVDAVEAAFELDLYNPAAAATSPASAPKTSTKNSPGAIG